MQLNRRHRTLLVHVIHARLLTARIALVILTSTNAEYIANNVAPEEYAGDLPERKRHRLQALSRSIRAEGRREVDEVTPQGSSI
jgi:hypothetical protein